MSDQEVLLEIRSLNVEGSSAGAWRPLLKNVDLTLHRGEVMGLIGESGAGKSTLGLACMGYARDGCRIASGSIRFGGIDLVNAPMPQLRSLRGRRIAYVAQSAAASFNPAFRLIDQFCEAPVIHRVKSRRAAMADAVSLYGRMRLPQPETVGLRYPHQVSGGQLQRAMTAMALACRPDLVIFDEPTTALDVTTQIEVLATIRSIIREVDAAAIYITHDLAVVAQMSDRIKVLLRGVEVEEAETRRMLKHPSAEYTRTLWAVRSFTRPEQPPPATGAVPTLAVRGVTAAYGPITVLRSVSIDLYPGRITAVVGESGSGKSTTARVITGLLPPTDGEVLLDGQKLAPSYRKRNKADLRKIQMIYQSADTALNPKLSIRDIIGRPAAFYGGLRGKALDRRVRDLLASIELEPSQFIDRLPHELSGGQKQRIGIARALAAEPRVIICDEVTSALDQLVAEGILKLLDRLRAEMNLSLMFITHDLATVRAIADEVVVMRAGEVVEMGAKSEMFQPPHHPYTEQLLASVPDMDPDWLDGVLAAQTVTFERQA